MPATVAFKLVSPRRVLFEGDAELVIAVTTEGEEGILPSHAPFLAALKPGVLRANVVRDERAERLEFATGEGFLQALPDGITILVDAAVTYAEVDRASTESELQGSTQRLAALSPYTPEFNRERSAMEYAQAKLALRAL